ncbi:MAG: hypothetical protein N3D12_04185 [Candidatus Methanomethyliaceae archaeon]|nr:hypothetical protein [Candidatus Methanomethyliaceae archaeon]
MSSEPLVYTIVIDGKRLLAISIIIATVISFTSIYVSGYYITQDQSLPIHGESIKINGTSVAFNSIVSLNAGAQFDVNFTVLFAEGYFTSQGIYYASPSQVPPGGYYALFPSAAQTHLVILQIYNNLTFSAVELKIQGGSLQPGDKITYNFTINPLPPGEYIFKFMVWSNWISQGGNRIADNSGGYVKVVVS